MAASLNPGIPEDLQIKGIELLNFSLNLPSNLNKPITNFNFNIEIESRADAANKLVFVIVKVEIKNDKHLELLGEMSVSCIFQISNFESVLKLEENGKVIIPQPLIETLNSISISTVRGVMYASFKGTLLHGAILPIIDQKQ